MIEILKNKHTYTTRITWTPANNGEGKVLIMLISLSPIKQVPVKQKTITENLTMKNEPY